MNFELISFATADELAQAVARAWLDEIEAAHRTGHLHCAAVSGGRIAQKFFSAVAEQSNVRPVPFDRVHFFWADERCVPPTHAESNFRIARELLFAPLKIPENQIHRVHGEDSPEAAAKLAEAGIRRVAPASSDGQPVLDLIFLGLGEDGHTASLFPGEPETVAASKAVYRAVKNSPKPPPTRITLGYPAIAAARRVWMLASGTEKEAALRESLSTAGKTPFARVLRSRAFTRIFTDIPIQ